jgi:hypothetical protein
MLFRETVAVYCENHREHTNTLCLGRMQSISMLKQVVYIVATGLKKGNKYKLKSMFSNILAKIIFSYWSRNILF